jgi:hypothetical protein
MMGGKKGGRAEKLVVDVNLDRGDDFYERLIDAHRGLSEEESRQLNARLILILANQIGEFDVLAEALELARDPSGKS